jgi:hypothetical protein
MTMAECPWCHGPVNDLRVPCPKCGKLATDLRATDPADPRNRPPAKLAMPAADVPDLVIPAAPASKPSLSSKPVAASPPPSPGGFDDDDLDLGGADLQIDLSGAGAPSPHVARPPTPGGAFNPFEDDLSAGPSLELDTSGGSLPPSISAPRISSPRISSPNVSNPPSGPSVPVAPISQRSLSPEPPPSGRPLSAERTSGAPRQSVDPYEAKVVADYGPPPSAFWHAPLYAYRVVTRRSALRRDLLARKIEAEKTAKRVEDALIALGERARALAKGGEVALGRVREAEELVRARDTALAGTMDTHKATIGEIDVRLSAAEADLARAREEETRVSAIRDAADEEAKRADAKLKRLEIEIRNGAITREAERGALSLDATQKVQVRAEAEQKLAEARRMVAAAQAKVDGIRGERGAQEARFSRQSGARNEGVEDAQKHLRGALVELGRAMLADPTLATELASARDEVARLEEQMQKRASDLALHESAIKSYDAPQVLLGFVLIAIALALVGVLIFFPMIYRSFVT